MPTVELRIGGAQSSGGMGAVSNTSTAFTMVRCRSRHFISSLNSVSGTSRVANTSSHDRHRLVRRLPRVSRT